MSKKWTDEEIEAVYNEATYGERYNDDATSFQQLILMVLDARAALKETQEDLRGAAQLAEACKYDMERARKERDEVRAERDEAVQKLILDKERIRLDAQVAVLEWAWKAVMGYLDTGIGRDRWPELYIAERLSELRAELTKLEGEKL